MKLGIRHSRKMERKKNLCCIPFLGIPFSELPLAILRLCVHYCIDRDIVQKKTRKAQLSPAAPAASFWKRYIRSTLDRALSIIFVDLCSLSLFSKQWWFMLLYYFARKGLVALLEALCARKSLLQLNVEQWFWPLPTKKLENDLETSSKRTNMIVMTMRTLATHINTNRQTDKHRQTTR